MINRDQISALVEHTYRGDFAAVVETMEHHDLDPIEVIVFMATFTKNLFETPVGIDPEVRWVIDNRHDTAPPLALQLITTMGNDDRETFTALLATLVEPEAVSATLTDMMGIAYSLMDHRNHNEPGQNN